MMWAWMTHSPKPVSPTRQSLLLCAGEAGQERGVKGCSPRERSKVRKVRRGQRRDHWTKGLCGSAHYLWHQDCVETRGLYLGGWTTWLLRSEYSFPTLSARPRILGHKGLFWLALLCFCIWSLLARASPGRILSLPSLHLLLPSNPDSDSPKSLSPLIPTCLSLT